MPVESYLAVYWLNNTLLSYHVNEHGYSSILFTTKLVGFHVGLRGRLGKKMYILNTRILAGSLIRKRGINKGSKPRRHEYDFNLTAAAETNTIAGAPVNCTIRT